MRRDHLTAAQRRRVMQSNRAKGTKPEVFMAQLLRQAGIRFRRHIKHLPGKPDFSLVGTNILVFVDGDFWHGYRFPMWQHTLPEFWREKIERNRQRDQRNFRKLRRNGWVVIRIWEHQLKGAADEVIARVASAVDLCEVRDCRKDISRKD